jgi:hypothetical protein
MVNNGFILSGAIAVRALRDIAPGEEILVRYRTLEMEQPELAADNWILGGQCSIQKTTQTHKSVLQSASSSPPVDMEID